MKTQHLAAMGLIAALAIGVQAHAQAPTPAAPANAQAAPAAPMGNAANGKKLFVSYGCYQCHGYEGQGSTATGPRLAPRPIPYAAFTKQLRRPSNEMPPYTVKVASDADLADIYAFLRSVPPPPDVNSLSLLKQ